MICLPIISKTLTKVFILSQIASKSLSLRYLDALKSTKNSEYHSTPVGRRLTEIIYHPPLKPFQASESITRSYYHPHESHDRVDPWPYPGPGYGHHEEDHDDLEKTFLHYIFPTILVIGLGSLIIPIIAVFFIAFTYTNGSASCIKSKGKGLVDTRRPYIDDILGLLVTVEKAFSRGEKNYRTKLKKSGTKKEREARFH